MNIIDETGAQVTSTEVSTQADAIGRMPAAQRSSAITALLSQSSTGLLIAKATHDLDSLTDLMAKSEAIAVLAKHKSIGKSIQQDAAAFVLQVERALGEAVKEGQGQGTIRAHGGYARNEESDSDSSLLPSPSDYLPSSGGARDHIRDMSDENVSDEDFDEILAEARAEGNLSRSNVARKALARAKAALKAREQADERFIDQDDLDALNTPKPDALTDIPGPKQHQRQRINSRIGKAVTDLLDAANRIETNMADERFTRNRDTIAGDQLHRLRQARESIDNAILKLT